MDLTALKVIWGSALVLVMLTQDSIGQVRINLEEVRDVLVIGAQKQDLIGTVVEGVGDVNKDGFDEFVFFTRGRSNDLPYSGYLIFGASDLPQTIDLADLPIPNVIEFIEASRMGSVGDLNGDGYSDFAAADVGFDLPPVWDVGKAIIFYGTEEFPSSINILTDSLPGMVVEGYRSGEWVGNDIRGIGDVNGDGFDDFGFQGWRVRGNNIAEVAFIYGGTDVPSSLSTEDLGSHGNIIISAFPLDRLGDSFAPAGDVNGDGFDDVIIGAYASGERPSRAYLIYGRTDFPALLNSEELGDYGVRFEASGYLAFAFEVSSAGDVNGDGLDDLLLVNPGESPNGLFEAGEVYLVFGSKNLPGIIDVNNIGTLGMTIQGTEADMNFAQRLSGPGNWDGDEFPDNAMAPSNWRNEILLFRGGSSYSQPRKVSVDALNHTTIWNPIGTQNYPNSIRFADLNGDGLDDMIIGEEFGCILKPEGGYERFNCGLVHIIYGGKFLPTVTSTPTITPTETVPIEPTPTLTPSLTPTPTFQETGKFSGWILSGDGKVRRQWKSN